MVIYPLEWSSTLEIKSRLALNLSLSRAYLNLVSFFSVYIYSENLDLVGLVAYWVFQIFTVAFLLFLASVGGSKTAGPVF